MISDTQALARLARAARHLLDARARAEVTRAQLLGAERALLAAVVAAEAVLDRDPGAA